MPSALRLLVGRQEGWWGAGMVICLEQGAETCIWPNWCQCHSLSLASVKSILVLPFWYRLTRVVLDKGPLNGCVCVRYTIIMWIIHGYIHMYYILFFKNQQCRHRLEMVTKICTTDARKANLTYGINKCPNLNHLWTVGILKQPRAVFIECICDRFCFYLA